MHRQKCTYRGCFGVPKIGGSELPKMAFQTVTQTLGWNFFAKSLEASRSGSRCKPLSSAQEEDAGNSRRFFLSFLDPAMPPGCRLQAAPSPTLLRFLRAQSEALIFSQKDIKVGCAGLSRRRPNAFPGAPTPHCGVKSVGRGLSARLLSTVTSRRNATLHAAVWDLESILPKSLRGQRTTVTDNKTKPPPASGGSQRHSSSDLSPRECQPRWKEWLFGPAMKGGSRVDDRDLCIQLDAETGSIFPRRSLTAKAALDPRLRCTEVDGNGDVIMVDGELKKSELIAKASVSARLYFSQTLLTLMMIVWTSSSGSPQDRLVKSPAHSRPPVGHPAEPSASQSPNQARPRLAIRRLRLDNILPPISLHVRSAGQATAKTRKRCQ